MTNFFFQHENALVETSDIGCETRIWAFAHILPNAKVGANCNICDHVFIENDVVIGDRVTIKCGVQLWDGIRVENDVFIGPNATFTNDRFPRSKTYPDQFLNTVVHEGASIGANATILPGVEIGSNAMVGAGAVVTNCVPPYSIVMGNPAVITGYVGTVGPDQIAGEDKQAPFIAGLGLVSLSEIQDMRGDLCVAEAQKEIPFEVLRIFFVYNVPNAKVRGEHAHKNCHQFLICVKGAVSVIYDDGSRRAEFRLDSPSLGLHIPPGVWGIQYKYTSDAVLMVLASDPYDPDDYIRDYSEFRKYVGADK